MKRKNLGSLLLVLGTILSGCGRTSPDSAKSEKPLVFGPQYSAKNGLLVPDDTRQSLGLKITEVTEQKVPATFEIPLLVYQAENGVARASGTVTPAQAKHLSKGQALPIRSRAGQTTTAKVTSVSDQLLKATGRIEILVAFTQPPHEFPAGTFTQATVTLDSPESVITIPRSALLECSDGFSVYTVSGEHFVRTPVKVGASNASFVEIKDGLYAGDQVVSQPVLSLWMTELAAVKGGQACCVEPGQ